MNTTIQISLKHVALKIQEPYWNKPYQNEQCYSYLDQLGNECKNQNKLECFLALNRKYILPEFFYTVRSQSGNRKRQTQT